MSLEKRLARVDWATLAAAIDGDGFATTEPLLTAGECAGLRRAYSDDHAFRSTIDMARHSFGEGQYRYFARPLPPLVESLRTAMYAPLADIANQWAERLGAVGDWPKDHRSLIERCVEAGQTRPTPLLLRYREGDYNCLHQDLYGQVHFPLQVVFLLSEPGADFEGGELVLVEHRPRLQSRPMVVPLAMGAAAIVPVRERPRLGRRGWSKSTVRHGVSRVRRGQRFTLGLIFHDAA